jgi:hypothetical protein
VRKEQGDIPRAGGQQEDMGVTDKGRLSTGNQEGRRGVRGVDTYCRLR